MWQWRKERNCFKKYKPSWEITHSGDVEILKGKNDYRVKIPIKVMFRNRDTRYEITVYLSNAKVVLWHKKDDREGDRYELKSNLATVVIPPSGDYPVLYTFTKELKAQPLVDVGSQVKYKVYPGEVVITNVSGIRRLGASNKCIAQVIQGVQGESDK